MRKNTVSRRILSVILSAAMAASMIITVPANAMTYCILTYLAGEADNIVGASEVHFDKIVNTTFDVASSSRFSRKGYTLKSWYVPSTGETVGTGSQYVMPDHDITFVANWEPVTYNITFAGKGGKAPDGSNYIYSTGTYGTSITLPENQFTYSGYDFVGWKYDGVIYKAGENFSIPALLSGSKIVFAAVWEEENIPVTTAPSYNDDPVTQPNGDTVITIPVNKRLDCTEENMKTCDIPLGDILSKGKPSKVEVSVHASLGAIESITLGLGTNVNNIWYQKDFNEYITTKYYTFDFAPEDVCSNMDGTYLEVGYWWGTAIPLYVDSITVTYGTIYDTPLTTSTTEATTTTTTTTTNWWEDTTTTTTTTTNWWDTTTTTTTTNWWDTTTTTTTTNWWDTTTTTTTTNWWDTTTTTTTTNWWDTTTTTTTTNWWDTTTTTTTTNWWDTTTTTTTTNWWDTTTTTTTTAYIPPAKPNNITYTKVVELNRDLYINNMLTLPSELITQTNQIVESIEFKFKANDYYYFGNYALSVSVARKDKEYEQFEYNDYCWGNELTITADIPEDAQAYIVSDNFISVGYWWGESANITLESVKINYKIKIGDYNRDGVVGNDDMDALRKYMVGVEKHGYDIDFESADVNCDGVINVFDCMSLSRLMN